MEAIRNQEIQIIGTSGTVTVLGAVHLNLSRYNRSAVDGLSISKNDLQKTISKIKRMGAEGRSKHPCIGSQKSDLTMAGCAIIESLLHFWPISEVTVADRGIREGILLDLMHNGGPRHHPRKRRNRFYERKNSIEHMMSRKNYKNESGFNIERANAIKALNQWVDALPVNPHLPKRITDVPTGTN